MRQVTWFLATIALALALGCSSNTNETDLGTPDDGNVTDVTDVPVGVDATDVESRDADAAVNPDVSDVADPDAVVPPDVPTDTATDPGPFTRPDKGDPVDSAEITRITDLYLDILKKARYFNVLDERVHGWPRSDEQERYWYGTWWSGIKILKDEGKISYLHSKDGADNNGMRSGPILVGACYAQKLWGQPLHLDLTRRMVRGFSSWAMAFRSPTFPDWETTQVLSRAAYPESITSTDGGREFLIDYSQNRPGEYNDACDYVHVADNPYWGDIWAKNKRSKDDIGHMLIALSMLSACLPDAETANPEAIGLRQDIAEAMEIYRTWAAQVDTDKWKIATVDKDGVIYYPDEDLAYLWLELENFECEAAVALRLFHGGDPTDIGCGNGILLPMDEVEVLKNDLHQIERSFHEAAVALAQMEGRPDVTREMMDGLAWRVDTNLDRLESATPPKDPNYSDLGELVLMAGNTGLPLTWREVRFLHTRIEEAHAALVGTQDDATMKTRFNVFSPDLPDGEYPFDPGDTGLAWRYLGAVLGVCASPYWNPASKQVLDCDKIRAATF
jgi:hypothetical protein